MMKGVAMALYIIFGPGGIPFGLSLLVIWYYKRKKENNNEKIRNG